MIVTGTIGEQIVPLIYEIPQLDTIYILCDNTSRHEQWSKIWTKVKDVYTQITPIYEDLQQAVKQYNEDFISVSFVSVDKEASNQNLDQLDPSFMYTQIFKEILLEMEYDRQSIEQFSTYCLNNDYGPLTGINQFKDEYHSHLAIWWYTRSPFIYFLLNQALRTLEGDTIIHMGFFIRDLHRQMQQLHQQQLSSYHGESFIVYRGQGFLKTDFEKLSKTQGGLMSFNNFLSTSRDPEVSLDFAEGALTSMDMVGILFKMAIDPFISSTPFAAIDEVSYFKTEEEVLFSMHTVFRIGEIKNLDKNNRLFQVDLKLTGDDDRQLRTLTDHIRKEVGGSGWQRLGNLLLKIGQFNKAEELYTVLLGQTSAKDEKALYYVCMGYVKTEQGDYEKAIWYYENGLEIQKEILPLNHPLLASSYNNIGGVYYNMGEYSKALSFYEKALETQGKTLPPNHPDLATSCSNIGVLYDSMGEYSKALSFFEKVLEIVQKTLPSNHPHIAFSYNNIGEVYGKMGEYSKTLSFYEKALEIYQKTLPPYHPSLATSYNNIGEVYRLLGEYSKALSFHEKSLDIRVKILPPNHPDFVQSYNNTGLVYNDMGENSKALSFFEKTRKIFEETLPPNHPSLATSYNNIGSVYDNMVEYSKALSFYEKALKILPSNHPVLATSYNNIGGVYDSMGKYLEALSSHEKAREIKEKTLPSNHPDLATSYNNIAMVYSKMKNYSKALPLFKRALGILQRSLPPNHPNIQSVRKSIEIVKKQL